MPKPGDVVLTPFVGADGVKQRPAVVVSSDVYHACRPDVILGLLTSQVTKATLPTDHILVDWAAAGLHLPTAFRSYFTTRRVSDVVAQIGVLSARDWGEVQVRLRAAMAV
jgi:mRNA interferase MazF